MSFEKLNDDAKKDVKERKRHASLRPQLEEALMALEKAGDVGRIHRGERTLAKAFDHLYQCNRNAGWSDFLKIVNLDQEKHEGYVGVRRRRDKVLPRGTGE